MKRFSTVVLLALFVAVRAGPATAADITQAELMQAAIELGRQYDANYADKNSAAMAALYAPDGLLVSPSGPIVVVVKPSGHIIPTVSPPASGAMRSMSWKCMSRATVVMALPNSP